LPKLFIRRFHLFLAIFSGVFLINLSISGSLLIYAKDIQALVNPQYWLVKPSHEQNFKQPLTLSAITKTITAQTGKDIVFIEQGESTYSAWQVKLTNKEYLSINPYSGDILLSYKFDDTFYGFVMAWHRWLLYVDKDGKRPLQLLVSISSLILIIELLLGIYLWAKPKHRIKRLKVKWQTKNKIRFHQLHTVLGVFCVLPLILIAFSGMAFYWQDASKQVVQWLTLSLIQEHNYQSASVTEQRISPREYQLDLAYQQAHSALTSGKVFRVYLPENPNELLILRIKMPGESHAFSWSWANPYNGDVVHSFDASKTSLATQVWNFKYKFHTGDFIAWPIKIVWLMLSLLPCFFVISGIYLWLKRKYG